MNLRMKTQFTSFCSNCEKWIDTEEWVRITGIQKIGGKMVKVIICPPCEEARLTDTGR